MQFTIHTAKSHLSKLSDWEHHDPFDRIIATTAEVSGAHLVSKDPDFDHYPGALQRLW